MKNEHVIEALCQYCGSGNLIVDDLCGVRFAVVCLTCGTLGAVKKTRAAALAAWATEDRAAERKLIARIGELKTALASEKDAHQKLRAAAQAARSILAEIDVREGDCAYTTASIGQAYQLLDQALDAETEAARTILGNIGTGDDADPIHAVVSIGNAYQLGGLTLDAETEAAKC